MSFEPGGAPQELSPEQYQALSQCVDWYNARLYPRPGDPRVEIIDVDAGLFLVKGGGVGHLYDPKTWSAIYADFLRRLGVTRG